MTTVIVFAVSVLGLTILFLAKDRELKTGEKNLFGRILSKFDQGSEKLITGFHYRIYQLFQSIRFLFLVRLPEKGRVHIEKTKESVLNNYNKRKDAIMGKKELSNNGSSSFFLRKVSENKNGNSEKGKIEESL